MYNTNELPQLVELLEKQKTTKKDYVAKGCTINYRDGKIWVQAKGGGFTGYIPTELFHDQVAEKLLIPKKYYDRMRVDNPLLLEHNINLWLAKDEKIKYLLRTFHNDGSGVARAMLSNSYNILDNYDVLFSALEAIKKTGLKVNVTKAQVTDKRMYLHIVCPEIEIQAEQFLKEYMKYNDAVGNAIVSGLYIANSEVGLGTYEIGARAVIVKCNNGLMSKNDSFKRVHLGKRMDEGEVQWSDETKRLNYQLVMSQTKDAIHKFLSPGYLGQMISRLSEANNIVLEHPIDTIQNVCQELDITDKYKQDILRYFVSDGDSKASGVFHAVTRAAQDMPNDVQFDVEGGAFDIMGKIKKFDKPFKASKN